MKTVKFFSLIVILITSFASCNNNDEPIILSIESKTVSNLHAPQSGGQGQPISGAFTKFDFSTGEISTSATDWDIAFRGTTIIVNGGVSLGTVDEPTRNGNAAAYIVDGTLASVNNVNTSLFKQDASNGYAIASGSGNSWYIYNPQTFLITPIAGKIIVLRTRDNKYAKIEILSYYKNAPSNPNAMVDEGRYFTFSYVYQPNDGLTNF